MRFQQFTSPVMAKGVEDTALYCFNRMIGLCEVGGDPNCGEMPLTEFHDAMAAMQTAHPLTMTTLATHDTKRADDVRARLAVLTEVPGRWKSALAKWTRMNQAWRTGEFPDRNAECLLYQTLIGAWPIEKDRVAAYMKKAVREAKQHTSWTQQNQEFEDALDAFIGGLFASREFLASMEGFVAEIRETGWANSLAQTLIKLGAPGVPDTYQGGELWDLSLVDPDNRRPVDYDVRRCMLEELKAGVDVAEIVTRMESGLPKLWLIHTALRVRREHPEWFGRDAAYTPVLAEGPRSEHLLGFLREKSVAVFAPRWTLKLGNNWAGTTVTLPEGRWTNRLTREAVAGGRIRLRNLLERFPVALLTREVAS